MSVVMNQKGVFARKLTISRHGSSRSNVTLNTVFIKSAEKYSVTATKFVTNQVPPLWRGSKTVMSIRKKEDQGRPVTLDWGNNIPERNWSELELENITSIPQLVTEMSRFLQRWNLKLQRDRLVLGTDYNFRDVEIGLEDQGDQPVKFCGIGLDSSGRLKITMSKVFAEDHYIIIDSEIGKTIGLGQESHLGNLLWVARDGNGVIITNSSPGETLFESDGQGGYEFSNDEDLGILTPEDAKQLLVFYSKSPILKVDRRLSIDVDVTLPHTNIITTVSGSETHEHTLLRFDLANYINTNGTSKLANGIIKQQIEFQDELQVGPTDFVRGVDQITPITMLPGVIHAVNTSLFVRYYEDDGIKRYPLDMDETSFWRLVLLFTKKTT